MPKRKRIKSHVQGEAVATAKTHPDRRLVVSINHLAQRDQTIRRAGETYDEWFERWLAEHWQG